VVILDTKEENSNEDSDVAKSLQFFCLNLGKQMFFECLLLV
jgi:hypothetical protein